MCAYIYIYIYCACVLIYIYRCAKQTMHAPTFLSCLPFDTFHDYLTGRGFAISLVIFAFNLEFRGVRVLGGSSPSRACRFRSLDWVLRLTSRSEQFLISSVAVVSEFLRYFIFCTQQRSMQLEPHQKRHRTKEFARQMPWTRWWPSSSSVRQVSPFPRLPSARRGQRWCCCRCCSCF